MHTDGKGRKGLRYSGTHGRRDKSPSENQITSSSPQTNRVGPQADPYGVSAYLLPVKTLSNDVLSQFFSAKKLIGQPQVWSVQMDNGLRFAFDFGAGTIGWAVYRLEDRRATELIGLGSRIFDDGRDSQTKESNAKWRREPRAMRRG